MNVLRILTFLWLLFMLILSHIGGKASGAESRWLSEMTGVNEGLLRRTAHVLLYLVLGCLVTVAWPDTALWLKCLVLSITAVIDETSKALPVFTGRHCSIVFCKYFLAKIPDKIPEFSFSKMAKISAVCISAFWYSMIPFQTFYLMGFIYEYCRIIRQYFFSVSTRQVWCQGLWSIYPSRPKWDVSKKRPDPLTP